MSEGWKKKTGILLLVVLTVAPAVALVYAIRSECWETATTYATLDKEWNSKAMIEARQHVHAPGSNEWDHSRLEGILEFFEKLASLAKVSGNMPFIYESTLGWYAAQYFLFAREHGQIEHLRKLWKEELYTDLEDLYSFYVKKEVRRTKKKQLAWQKERLSTEHKFWEQERKD